jgi:hypothetical protein
MKGNPEMAIKKEGERREMPVKIPERVLSGVYANQMVVSHTGEEFLLDFVNLFPPEGVVNARVIVSPGHLKRMIRALQDNLRKYEGQHGQIMEAPAPTPGQLQN